MAQNLLGDTESSEANCDQGSVAVKIATYPEEEPSGSMTGLNDMFYLLKNLEESFLHVLSGQLCFLSFNFSKLVIKRFVLILLSRSSIVVQAS